MVKHLLLPITFGFLIENAFNLMLGLLLVGAFEPRCEKTGLRGLRSGPTQTGLHSHITWLEA